jgi:hypothetical protein
VDPPTLADRRRKPDGPIAVDWVDLAAVPGRAAGAAAAGARLGMTRLADARALRPEDGVDDLLLLVEDHELGGASFAGIEVHRHPIPDFGVPADPIAFRATLDRIRALLADGRSVVVACRGGRGRTGTVVACLLREAGLDGPAAIALTRATRPGAIETAAQERFIGEWQPVRAQQDGGPTR